MDTQTTIDKSRKDSIVTAISLLVVVIGTATGNAFTMLVMAAVASGMIAIWRRQDLGWHGIWVMIVAAVTAAAIAFTMST
jgi:hypothetical protein